MVTAKTITLIIHNLLRWAIVFSALYVLIRLFRGWLKKLTWQDADRKAIVIFTILLDSQLLVGLLLYFVFSDLVKAAFANFSAAMSNDILRFFTIEHTLTMVIAIVLGHIASAASKKDLPDQIKFKRTAILTTLALLLLLAGIPWTGRPLIPGF
jgi:hypothetical protein